jgi:hypothetical protein
MLQYVKTHMEVFNYNWLLSHPNKNYFPRKMKESRYILHQDWNIHKHHLPLWL